MKYKINYDTTIKELITPRNNIVLYDELSKQKNMIDSVSRSWNKIKKYIHDYEYIYTSPNKNKNIANFLPISRSYFKLKEILIDYDIYVKGYKIFCMGEAPGGFVQCLCEYPINKIYGNSLVNKNDDSVPKWNYKIIINKLVDIYTGSKNNGDLCDLDNIFSYIKYIGKGTLDLVTGDGGFDYSEDYNKQEENSIPLIYSEVLVSMILLKTNGNFICKIFDIFNFRTMQILYIISLNFSEFYISKPKCSRLSNSEKYLICLGYKGYNQEHINLLLRNFADNNLNIQIDKKFNQAITDFNTEYLEKQKNKINNGLSIDITKINHPTENQINLAVDWCKKYNIPINKYCYYINGQDSHSLT